MSQVFVHPSGAAAMLVLYQITTRQSQEVQIAYTSETCFLALHQHLVPFEEHGSSAKRALANGGRWAEEAGTLDCILSGVALVL